VAFDLVDNLEAVLKLMQKYEDVPASLADACLVRMTETLADPLVLTTDTDFRVYRRMGARSFLAGCRPEQGDFNRRRCLTSAHLPVAVRARSAQDRTLPG
jgi:hypothetical protein